SSLHTWTHTGGGGGGPGGGGGDGAGAAPDAHASATPTSSPLTVRSLAACTERDREEDRARPGEQRKKEAAVILASRRRQIGAAERYGLPPHERPAAFKAQLNQAPGGVDPGGRCDHQQRVIDGRASFAIPKEHGPNLPL